MIENAAYVDMDPRRRARFLYWTGWRVCEIARELALNEKTVHAWKARDGWDDAGNVERIGGALEARLVQLILKEGKSGGDFKEIDLLHRQLDVVVAVHQQDGGRREHGHRFSPLARIARVDHVTALIALPFAPGRRVLTPGDHND